MTVAITGVATLSSLGEDFAGALLKGRTAFSRREIASRAFPGPTSLYAAHLEELPARELLGKKGLRSLSRESTALMCAAVLACRDAGIDPASWSREEVGVFAATVLGGLDDYVTILSDALHEGTDHVNPARGPQTGLNAPASQLAIRLGAEGPNMTFSTGATSGAEAIAHAVESLDLGRGRRVLAGGVDTWSALAARALCGGVAGPDEPPRPFDRDRTGTVYGEAAVMLVLESGGAGPVVRGAGRGFDPRPGGRADAARRALTGALAEAGLDAGDVDAVVASASGDESLDADEAKALADVIGEDAPVYAPKGSVGECLGASGGLQAAAAALILGSGIVPATPNFSVLDSEGPRIGVATSPVRVDARNVLVHALDAGGQAVALVIAKERG